MLSIYFAYFLNRILVLCVIVIGVGILIDFGLTIGGGLYLYRFCFIELTWLTETAQGDSIRYFYEIIESWLCVKVRPSSFLHLSSTDYYDFYEISL